MALFCSAANAQSVTTVIGGDCNTTVDLSKYSPWQATSLYAETTGTFSERLADLQATPPIRTFDLSVYDPAPVELCSYGDNYSIKDGVYTFKSETSTVSYNQDKSTLTIHKDGELLYNGYSSFYANGITITMKSDQVSVVVNTSKQTFEIKLE